MRSYINKVYLDGVDKTSSVQGNLRYWPAKKTISFDAATVRSIGIYANDAERGCANGGFALKCESSDPAWNINTNDRSAWKVWSTSNSGSTPPKRFNRQWYDPKYEPSGDFKTPAYGSTTDAVIPSPLAPPRFSVPPSPSSPLPCPPRESRAARSRSQLRQQGVRGRRGQDVLRARQPAQLAG